VSTKKRAPSGAHARDDFFVEIGFTSRRGTGDRLIKVRDPQSGRSWQWLESEQPGLHFFLLEWRDHWWPLAHTGEKFTTGRKPGSGGPIRKAIARLLKRHPDFRPRELWQKIAAHPPRGWSFHESPRLGKYIEGPKGQNMNYGRFSNVCKEERDKLI
jgi:hypothetical protein